MKDKHKDKQNNSGISATAGKLLRSYVLRKIFSYLMDDVLGLGEASEQLIDWLRELLEED